MLPTTIHCSPRALPQVSANLPRSAPRTFPGPSARICCVSGRPWSEYPFRPLPLTCPSAHEAVPTTFKETIEIAFPAGDKRNVIDLSMPVPPGKRLLFQSARLMSALPFGQRADVVIGSALNFDGKGYAPISLYADRNTIVKAQVTRDSGKGAGQVTLVVERSYVALSH